MSEPSHAHNPVVLFFRGVFRSKTPVTVWVLYLGLVNGVLPLFFLPRTEVLVVLAVFLVGFCALVLLTSHFGFTRILGLGHALWIPLVGYLIFRLPHDPPTDVFGILLRIVVVTDSVSLVFDITDVIRYVRGDRSDILKDDEK